MKGQGDCNRTLPSRSTQNIQATTIYHLAFCKAISRSDPHYFCLSVALLWVLSLCCANLFIFCQLDLMRFPLRLAFDLRFSHLVPRCGRKGRESGCDSVIQTSLPGRAHAGCLR